MRAKKSLGQHFLTNPRIASRIVEALVQQEGVESIVEVGPGRGILTDQLVERSEALILIEKDRSLIPFLQQKFSQAHIIEIDFLKANLAKLTKGDSFHLIGNFPYNISSQIVFKMLDNKQSIPQMVGMFQKEVAMRLAAEHGGRQYGILSVLLQAFYEVEVLFHLQPGAFTPPPKVQSSIIRCVRKPTVEMGLTDEKFFRKVVKLAFGQRRKMLRNALQSVLAENRAKVPATLLTRRAEQLSVAEFIELSRSLQRNTETL
ncbi:MAG: 16S rRNA (adenine(1518)-N(6)/adenine(1519)-N(6))-dimethyltransferase RsmA [Saprospiraceae bacterium]|nr:16S rRNA (adenine(1518)-N(6)/adenine(1519)-N(6))-dimethyltransferase RsmA [Saprospiraceae bacterium]